MTTTRLTRSERAANTRRELLAAAERRFFEHRPAVAYAKRVIPEYTGHVRAGTLPDAWLEPLRASA